MSFFKKEREVVRKIENASVDKFKGCLIGGAIGDALGYPIEFKRTISEKVTELEKDNVVSDDTQMTLFTANALLWRETRGKMRGICPTVSDSIYLAYQDWLRTQNAEEPAFNCISWIAHIPALNVPRAPGNTCLSALASGTKGTLEKPINQSKGCGSVMRVAPIGLYFSQEPLEQIGIYGAEAGAITHGHPLGIMPCYLFTVLINLLSYTNLSIEEATQEALRIFKENFSYYDKENKKIMIEMVEKAISLAHQDKEDEDAISELGEGWVAEEALAIAIYACMKYTDDFKKAVVCAVNHGGDSDSTGAIAGNIIGTFLGYDSIPDEYKNEVELKDVILSLAEDLYRHCPMDEYSSIVDESWVQKYMQNNVEEFTKNMGNEINSIEPSTNDSHNFEKGNQGLTIEIRHRHYNGDYGTGSVFGEKYFFKIEEGLCTSHSIRTFCHNEELGGDILSSIDVSIPFSLEASDMEKIYNLVQNIQSNDDYLYNESHYRKDIFDFHKYSFIDVVINDKDYEISMETDENLIKELHQVFKIPQIDKVLENTMNSIISMNGDYLE